MITWNARGLCAKHKHVAALNLYGQTSPFLWRYITGQMQKPWVGWLYQATYTSNSRGVAILTAKTVQFQLHSLQSEPQGRSLFLHTTISGLEVLLIAFHIPPPFQFPILQDRVAFMAKHPTVPAVWLGDFNMTINPSTDRLRSTAPVSPQPSITMFGRFLLEFTMIDTWRHKYPTAVTYSCFTPLCHVPH